MNLDTSLNVASPGRALDVALMLASRGFSVFGLAANKRPAAGSHGHLDATRDPDELRDRWRRAPLPLVAIATGERSGVDVVDFDTAKHPEAQWFIDRYLDDLPPTLIAKSGGSGGAHFYFRHAPGLGSSRSHIFQGVDVRADGGYVVAWAWLGGTIIEDEPIARWPGWLLDRAREEDPPPPRLTRPRRARVRSAAGDDAREAAWLASRVDGITTTVRTAHEGQRRAKLLWGARVLATLALEGRMARSEAWSLATRAGLDAGLPQREVEATATDAFAYAERRRA